MNLTNLNVRIPNLLTAVVGLIFYSFVHSPLAAQSWDMGNKKLQKLILKEAKNNQSVLNEKPLTIDWESHANAFKLSDSWLSAEDLSPIDLKLTEANKNHLKNQYSSQSIRTWETLFLEEINSAQKSGDRYSMSHPVFSKDRKMAFITYANSYGDSIILYLKRKGKWKRFAMFQLWGT